MEQRINRQIAAMTEAEKQALVDKHIGPIDPGHAPDLESDERYLRGIVGDMLRHQDALVEANEKSGVAKLEKRVKALEAILGPGGQHLFEIIAAGIAKAVPDLLKRQGYMRHRGTWTEDQSYSKGDCTVASGATWLAIADPPTGTKPGAGLEWRLVAKSGDGK